MKKNKKATFLMILGVLLLIVITASITYAFFKGLIGPGATSNIETISKSTDSLLFEAGTDLSIIATQQNFTPGSASLSASTSGTAKLVANNNTNSASYTYNVGLDITSNNYVYTTGGTKTPELILTITDPTGNPVTNIPGLNYINSGDVLGFDVTTATGKIKIAENYSITANATPTTQNWTFKLTFVNLVSNQASNAEKTFTSVLKIQNNAV